MRPSLCCLALTSLLAVALVLPGQAGAQSSATYTFALMGGLGGSNESTPDVGFDNVGFQGLFAMKTAARTTFQIRAGQLTFDVGDDDLDLLSSDLRYVTLAGHYTFPGGFYESGVFVGVGVYDVVGEVLVDDETSWGLNLGVTGDFKMSKHWSVVAEVSAHYADLDVYQYLLMGNLGLAVHF